VKNYLVFLAILFLFGCAAYNPRPVDIVKMKVMNNSYELTQDELITGKLAIIPCKNKSEYSEITSLLDSVLINQLPEIFPEFVNIVDSFDLFTELRNSYSVKYDFNTVINTNVSENFLFFVEVDSLWQKHIEGTSMNASGNVINSSSWLITIMELNVSIYDQKQARIVWERKIQSSVSEIESPLLMNIHKNDNYLKCVALCNQAIKPVTVALNVLKLPIDLQIELDKINMSDNYDISGDLLIKLFKFMGANVTKKRLDYKIEKNNKKIYLPIDSGIITEQNYNEIKSMMNECKIYYEKFTKEIQGYM